MQTDHRILDDLARVAGGALGAIGGIKDEVEARLRQQFERILSRMDLVTREEFEVTKAVARTAREEQEKLAEKLARLEAKIAQGEGKAVPKR